MVTSTSLYAQLRRWLVSRGGVAPAVLARALSAKKHCEGGDIVIRDAQVPDDVEPGDLLAVAQRYSSEPVQPDQPAAVVAVPAGVQRLIPAPGDRRSLLSLEVR